MRRWWRREEVPKSQFQESLGPKAKESLGSKVQESLGKKVQESLGPKVIRTKMSQSHIQAWNRGCILL